MTNIILGQKQKDELVKLSKCQHIARMAVELGMQGVTSQELINNPNFSLLNDKYSEYSGGLTCLRIGSVLNAVVSRLEAIGV